MLCSIPAVPRPSRKSRHCASSARRVALTASVAKRSLVVNVVRLNSVLRSDISAPAALSVAPTSGMTTRLQPSRRAIWTELRPAAPPPPISTASRGSTPWLMVMSSMAWTMFWLTTSRTAAAASCAPTPKGAPTFSAIAAVARSVSSAMAPPRKKSASM